MTELARRARADSTESKTSDPQAPLSSVVLAAGCSSRLGRPKQLVMYQGVPLVARAALSALEAGASPVVVVLGAHASRVRAALSGIPVLTVVNPEWRRGIGTSIAVGVRAVAEHAPSARAVLVMLADQPLVTGAALGRLIRAWGRSDARSQGRGWAIVAAAYQGTRGVPAVFGRAHFEALCSLPATAGAARLLRHADACACPAPMPEAALDIDTPSDLERLAPTRRCALDHLKSK